MHDHPSMMSPLHPHHRFAPATAVSCTCASSLQVRRNLHLVLCFSPVGDRFRVRARQFPALVNCTQLDWFHGWPAEALLSVANRFLADVPDVESGLRSSMAQYMAQAHQARHSCAWHSTSRHTR